MCLLVWVWWFGLVKRWSAGSIHQFGFINRSVWMHPVWVCRKARQCMCVRTRLIYFRRGAQCKSIHFFDFRRDAQGKSIHNRLNLTSIFMRISIIIGCPWGSYSGITGPTASRSIGITLHAIPRKATGAKICVDRSPPPNTFSNCSQNYDWCLFQTV